MITQVLLLNLLIAMMNDTYASAKADGTRENNLNFATTTSEMAAASVFFPPLNLITPAVRALRWCGIELVPKLYRDLHQCLLPEATVKLLHQPDKLLQAGTYAYTYTYTYTYTYQPDKLLQAGTHGGRS